MRRLLSNVFTPRLIAACSFFLVTLALTAATVLREPLASVSPEIRSRTLLAMALSQGRNPESYERAARDLAYRDPLQAASFVLIAIKRISQDSAAFDKVQPLMQAALQRQPILATSQVWLAADFARRGDYKRSLAFFDQILSQSDDQAALLMPALKDLVQHAPSRSAVIERLKRFPTWRTAFLSEAIAAKALSDEILVKILAGPVPPRHLATVQLERMQFVAALVTRGEVARAHNLYRRYVGINPKMQLYDGEFRAAKPFTPFGWTLASAPEDYSERVAQSESGWMLRAHSSGKRASTLLEQTLALPPGRWKVEMVARDAGLAKPERMQIVIECLADGTRLGTQSLAGLSGADSIITTSLNVTSGCALQRLAIKAADNDGADSEIEVISMKVLRS